MRTGSDSGVSVPRERRVLPTARGRGAAARIIRTQRRACGQAVPKLQQSDVSDKRRNAGVLIGGLKK